MSSSPERHLWAVVLAGGVGSRFWPASTPRRPKQLLPLASDSPLIRDTIDRVRPLIPLERVRILTGARLADPIRSAVPGLGDTHFLLEPRAAGTAPALAWAAAEIERQDPDGIMVSLHSDHVIRPEERFRERLLDAAATAAAHRCLVTIGAVPDRPETGYGYIRLGPTLPGEGTIGARRVAEFVEKPDRETAVRYLSEGTFLWNTGIFVWRVADLLDQLERHTPELAALIPRLRAGDHRDFFERTPNLSIDEGLLERSDRVAVLPATFEWDDIGAWDAVFRTNHPDASGNVRIGDAHAVDTRGTALYTDGGPLVAFGVEDLVVVHASGVTFVTTRQRSGELKQLLQNLPDRLTDLS
jgi:mannose-1-phosphate guanylyltransferase